MFPFGGLMVGMADCELKLSTFNALSIQSGFARAGLAIRRDGDAQNFSHPSWFEELADEWFQERCRTATVGDAYEAFYSGTGSTPTGAALDTWLPVNVDLEWFLEQTGIGAKTFNGTMQVREIANPDNIVSAAAQIHAQVVA